MGFEYYCEGITLVILWGYSIIVGSDVIFCVILRNLTGELNFRSIQVGTANMEKRGRGFRILALSLSSKDNGSNSVFFSFVTKCIFSECNPREKEAPKSRLDLHSNLKENVDPLFTSGPENVDNSKVCIACSL